MSKRTIGIKYKKGVKVDKREIQLGQTKYMILQYLKKNTNQFITCGTIASELMMSRKTVAQHIRDMIAMGIVTENYPVKNLTALRELKVNSGWLQ